MAETARVSASFAFLDLVPDMQRLVLSHCGSVGASMVAICSNTCLRAFGHLRRRTFVLILEAARSSRTSGELMHLLLHEMTPAWFHLDYDGEIMQRAAKAAQICGNT